MKNGKRFSKGSDKVVFIRLSSDELTLWNSVKENFEKTQGQRLSHSAFAVDIASVFSNFSRFARGTEHHGHGPNA
jgi:hypothetical protein